VAEEVLIVNAPPDRFVHVDPVVDEMRESEFLAVAPLLRPLATEPHMVGAHAGAAVEVVPLEPTQCAGLRPLAALGDEPDAAGEVATQLGDRLERARHLGCGQHGGLVTGEECSIAAGWVGRSVDDDPAYVDAEPRLSIRCHATMVRVRPSARNYN
jgi:hypothetical protein